MKKIPVILIIILLSLISCKKTENIPTFNFIKEKNNIDILIKNQKLGSLSYYKKHNDNNLYTGEAIINSLEDTPEYSYTVWYENNQILEIYITNVDSENGGVQENYYFKSNGDVFCYQYLNVSFPNAIDGNRATFFLDDNTNSIKEIYEINEGDNIFKVTDRKTFNQENFDHKILYNKNLHEVLKFYGLEECLNIINQASNNNQTATEKTVLNSPNNNKIDSKSVAYLQKYEDPEGLGPHEVNFKKIGKNVFWVTYYHDAGIRQEYYWKNSNNLLVPCFIFEYGGDDWDASLGYYFKDVKTGKKEEGNATEANIIQLKERFIKENFKNN